MGLAVGPFTVPSVVTQLGGIVPRAIARRGPRPAGVFPLRLRREAISFPSLDRHLLARDLVVRGQRLLLAQSIAEGDGVKPRNVLHRQAPLALEKAGIVAHGL